MTKIGSVGRSRFSFRQSRLLHAVLVSLDHLLDHLTADAAGLTRGQITVVTLLQVDANLGRCTRNIKQIFKNR